MARKTNGSFSELSGHFWLLEAPDEWRGSAEDQLAIIYGDQPDIGTRLSGV